MLIVTWMVLAGRLRGHDTTDKFLYLNESTLPTALRPVAAARRQGGDERVSGLDAGDPTTGAPALWVTNHENELHGLYWT